MATLLALAGCKDSPSASGGASSSAAAKSVSIATIEQQAKGFNVGAAMSARVVYVFFDPQCPHCAALWNSAKPLKSQARFVWIPVAVLNGNSLAQGAALLAAPDPVAAMDSHEQLMAEKRGGIVPAGNVDAQKEAVTRNTKMLDGFGIASVPTLVMKQGDGARVQEGAMPTDALARWIGAQP
nr:thioredoxin fold domain-containing protein [Ramlibacter albus]